MSMDFRTAARLRALALDMKDRDQNEEGDEILGLLYEECAVDSEGKLNLPRFNKTLTVALVGDGDGDAIARDLAELLVDFGGPIVYSYGPNSNHDVDQVSIVRQVLVSVGRTGGDYESGWLLTTEEADALQAEKDALTNTQAEMAALLDEQAERGES